MTLIHVQGVDVVNTDMWHQYSYSTPIQSYAPSGFSFTSSDFSFDFNDLLDPYGYFFQKYERYKDVTSIFYFDWEYLLLQH